MAKTLMQCLLLGGMGAGMAAAAPTVERRAPAVAAVENTLPLQRQMNMDGVPRPFWRKLSMLADSEPVAAGSGIASAEQRQIEYLTSVKAGSETYLQIVDTGSSDTWFPKQGFTCMNPGRTGCGFGKTWKGDFPGGQITNMHLNITYGYSGGPFVNGDMGYSDLTVANVTVPKQQIGLATRGRWRGDDLSSGILGLGLPGLTDAFTGAVSQAGRDGAANLVGYSPLVTTIGTQFSKVFALALHRDKAKSFLSFGGIPPGIQVTSEWATTPIIKAPLRNREPDYLYYQIGVDRFEWESSRGNGSEPRPPAEFIVDSGTTINMLPSDLARKVNDAFVPPARYDGGGQWFVRCNATAPRFGVQIGGKMLWTDPTSMILPELKNPSDPRECVSGIGMTSGWPYILGDTFMQGLISVFDIGKMELRFAHRT